MVSSMEIAPDGTVLCWSKGKNGFASPSFWSIQVTEKDGAILFVTIPMALGTRACGTEPRTSPDKKEH